MSRERSRRLLFAVMLLTVPAPFYLGQPELVPVLRMVFVTAIFSAVFAAEGGGLLGMTTGIGLLQCAFYAGLLFGVAALLARLIDRLAEEGARKAAVAVLAATLVVASLFPIYDTPLSSARLRSNVLQLFD